MAGKIEKLKPSFILIICFLILFLSVGTYVFFYVPAKKVRLTERYMRQAAVMSYQFESLGQNISSVIDSACREATDLEQLKDKVKQGKLFSLFDNFSMSINEPCVIQPPIKATFTDINYIPQDETLQFGIQFGAANTLEKGNCPATLNIKVEEVVRYISQNDDFDDTVIIDGEQGNVIYLKGKSAEKGIWSSFSAAKLGSLIGGDESKSGDSNNQSPPLDEIEDHLNTKAIHSHVIDFAFGSSSYKLFLQPIGLSFVKNTISSSPEKYWYIGGLVSTRSFDQRLRRIPVFVSLLFVVIIMASLGAYPLLKICLMGVKERFRVRDVLFIVISLMIGIPLILYSIMTISGYLLETSRESATAKDLKALAEKLHDNFLGEVNSAYGQLTDLVGVDPHNNISIRNKDCFFAKGIESRDETPRRLPSYRYPFFDLIFLADSNGDQQYKLHNGDMPLTFHNVAQRDYFKRILNEDYWYLTPPDSPTPKWPMALDLVYSMTNGSHVLILAIPRQGKVLPEQTEMRVAAISFRPLAVTRPVFPAHYGFAFIDTEGKVIFHSDPRLNSIENFFAECDDPLAIKGAVFAKANIKFPIKAVYQGQARDLYVQHFDGLPWSIVVFKDRSIDGLFSLTKIIYAGSLYGYYVFLFIISFLIFVALYLAEKKMAGASKSRIYQKFRCVWPDNQMGLNYLILSLLNIICFGILIWRLYSRTEYHLVLPTVLLLLGYNAIMKSLYDKYRNKTFVGDWLTILILPTGVLLFWFLILGNVRDNLFILIVYILLNIIYFLFEAILRKSRMKMAGSWFGRNSHGLVIYTLFLLLFAYPALVCFHFYSKNEKVAKFKYQQLMFADDYMAWRDWLKKNYESKLVALAGANPSDPAWAIYALPSQKMDIKKYAGWRSFKIAFKTNENEVYRLKDELISENMLASIIENTLPIDYAPLARILYLRQTSDSHPRFIWKLISSHGLSKTFMELSYNFSPGLRYNETIKDVEKFYVVSEYADSAQKANISFSLIVGIFLIAIFLTLGLFYLVRYAGQKIFLTDYESGEANARKENNLISNGRLPQGRLFVLGKPGLMAVNNKENADFQKISTKDIIADNKILDRVLKRAKGLIITDFDHEMHSASANLKKIELLERLLFTLDANVTVISRFEPLQYFNLASPAGAETSVPESGQDSQAPKDPLPSTEELLIRWKRALSCFTWKYLFAGSGPVNLGREVSNLEPKVKAFIEGEAESERDQGYLRPVLKHIGDDIRNCATVNPAVVKEIVGERAKPIYDSLWFASTIEEKLTMVHLAQEGMINAKDKEIISRLLKRRIIKLFPTRLMNDTFKDYVKSAEDLDAILKWEKEGLLASDWRKVSRPLLFLAIGTVVFLVVTQPGLLNSWLAVGAAVTTSIPAVLRAVDTLMGNITKAN